MSGTYGIIFIIKCHTQTTLTNKGPLFSSLCSKLISDRGGVKNPQYSVYVVCYCCSLQIIKDGI